MFSFPLNYILCGEKIVNTNSNNDNNKFSWITNLRHIEEVKPSFLEAQWIVTSKYKLRQIGEKVRDGDHIVFKNVREAQKCLIIPQPSYVAMANMNMNPSTDNNQNTANNGLQVAIIQKAKYTKSNQLVYGDFVTLFHLEKNSELICRIDDEEDFHPPYAHIGIKCRGKYTFIFRIDMFKCNTCYVLQI